MKHLLLQRVLETLSVPLIMPMLHVILIHSHQSSTPCTHRTIPLIKPSRVVDSQEVGPSQDLFVKGKDPLWNQSRLFLPIVHMLNIRVVPKMGPVEILLIVNFSLCES